MSFYVQHGYGKSTKVEELCRKVTVDGVVLSPADEDYSHLKDTVAKYKRAGLRLAIDPQTYIYSSGPDAVARNHGSNGIAFKSIHWSQDATATQRQIDAIGQLNSGLGIDQPWIAPTVLQSNLGDSWTALAFQLARTAESIWGGQQTIASVAIDEAALSSWPQINNWLDIVTTLNVRGFYIVVQRSNVQYPPVAWNPERLSNLLRLIHILGTVNGYFVHWAYSDLEGLLGLGAGASAISTGWLHGLRQFSTSKWVPSKGGKSATIRVPMSRLWTSIRAENEALDLFRSNLRNEAFTRKTLDRFPSGQFGSLDRTEAQSLYLEQVARQAKTLANEPSVRERLNRIELSLSRGLNIYQNIEQNGLVLESKYKSRHAALVQALALFRSAENL